MSTSYFDNEMYTILVLVYQ